MLTALNTQNEDIDMDDGILTLETQELKFASIKESARLSLANHSIIDRIAYWECTDKFNNEESPSFRISILPGIIVLWGDLGTMVIDKVEDVSMSWLISNIDSPDYIFSKCSQVKLEYFYSGNFKSYITELNNSEIIKFVDNDWSEYSASRYRAEYLDSTISSNVYGAKPVFIWCYCALHRFIELLKQQCY